MKSLILTHADADGICAGALALAAFPGSGVFFTKPVSFLKDLRESNADRIVICDIALTKRDAPQILEELSAKKSKILYFDHHPIPKTINIKDIYKAIDTYVHDRSVSSSELVYRHFQDEIPRERVWIAIYGAIGDYTDNTKFVKERMRNWDRRALYFEVSTLILGIKRDEFTLYDAKRGIAETLARGRNPSDVSGLVMAAKKAVNDEFELYEEVKEKARASGKVGFVLDIKSFGFRGPAALFAATVTDKPVGFTIHTRKKYLDITARSRDYELALGSLMEKAAELVEGSGGGLRHAAGARIPLKALDKFLDEVNGMI